ncbi:hypothetical protein AAY473_011686 [Plecturocebus cupreus]
MWRDSSHSHSLPGGTSSIAARLRPKAKVQMPLREQRYMGVDEDGHMVVRHVFTYLPFTSADLINWKNNTPSYTEKPQALIDLLQTIVQTHNSTWADCHQLLMYLFNMDEEWRVPQAASKWLEDHVPADYQNPQHYVRIKLLGTDPQWDLNTLEGIQRLIWYRVALLEGLKKGAQKATNINKISEVIQGKEHPAQFYERLCEAFCIYTLFDPEIPENQWVVSMAFVSQCAGDTRRKLQKQAGFAGMNTSQLLEIANQVFVNRDVVSHRESHRENECQVQQSTNLIAATIRGAHPEGWGKRGS